MKQLIYPIKTVFFLAFCLLPFFISGQNTSLPVGALPGAIDISPTGAASYTVPIEVIPGTQGLQPNLSVVYHSQSGMGVLGEKWDLAGLSAITRVPQTLYHDHNVTAVDLTSADRFSLDGNRLMLSSGSYGAPGSRYVTETETFSKITAYNNAGTGPQYFQVITDEGNIIEYGKSDNSRQMLGDVALSWRVNKITDPNGNSMDFTYMQSSGEIWLSQIEYTMNETAGISVPYAKIMFNYRTGTHYHSVFVAGREVKQQRILENIQIQYKGSSVRQYTFDYTGELPPRLLSIRKSSFTGGGGELNPTVIYWGEPTAGTFQKENFPNSPFDIRDVLKGHLTGDFNGDGLCDIVEYRGGNLWVLYYQTSNGTFVEGCRGTLPGGDAIYTVIDEDHDGKDELLITNRSQTTIQTDIKRFHNGGHTSEMYLRIFNGSALNKVMSGNFTGGDGSEVLIWYTTPANQNKILLKGLNFETLREIVNGSVTLMNFNGNDKTDICVSSNNNYYIYEYNNTSREIDLIKTYPAAGLPDAPMVGDFNGDGISDLLWRANGSYRMALGTGGGFTSPFDVMLSHTSMGFPIICDLNGDGKDDFIGLSPTGGLLASYYLSKGYANGKVEFVSCFNYSLSPHQLVTPEEVEKGYEFLMGDFNNDHKYDFIVFKKNPQAHSIHYFQGGDQNHFAREIKDGMGYTHKISYTPFYAFSFDYMTFRRRPVFCYLPAALEVSNGIGNTLNRTEYLYKSPYYSYKRRLVAGFYQFKATNILENRKTIYDFELESSREILKPTLTEVYYIRGNSRQEGDLQNSRAIDALEKQIIYSSKIHSLPYSFIQYNEKEVIVEALKGSQREILTGLFSNGRVDYLNTALYDMSSTSHITREEKKFAYTSITLPNGAAHTCPASITTTWSMKGSTLSPSRKIAYTYSGGRIKTIVESDAERSITTTMKSYDHFGLPLSQTTSTTGCTSRSESWKYDPTGRFPTRYTNPQGHSTSYTYDPVTGQVLTERDMNILTTSYEYDAFGRLKTIIYPDNTSTSVALFWYTSSLVANAKYFSRTIERGKTATFTYYDLLGREICREIDGGYVDTRYNTLGQITRVSYPYLSLTDPDNKKRWTDYTYDDHGRKSTEIGPTTNFLYYHDPGSTTTRDRLRNVSYLRMYDAAERTIRTVEPSPGGTVNYSYSYVSEGGKIRDQILLTMDGSSTTILNDLWGNRVKLIDPDAGTVTFTYNGFNELTRQNNANGTFIAYSYDKLGRVLSKEYTENSRQKTALYSYDEYSPASRGWGQLSTIHADGVLKEKFTYDGLGRLQSNVKTIGDQYTFTYSYNTKGLLDVVTYPGNFAVKYTYDSYNRVASILNNDNGSLIYKASGRNQFGKITLCSFGNNTASAFQYDDCGKITQIRTGNKVETSFKPGIVQQNSTSDMQIGIGDVPPSAERGYTADSTIQNLRYAYNTCGLMSQRKDVLHNQCETFSYDPLDRLTSHTVGCDGTINPLYYSYSKSGNIDSSSYLGSYKYGSGNNQPHAVNKVTLTSNNAISPSECCVRDYNAFHRPLGISEGNCELTIQYDTEQQRNYTSLKQNGNVIKSKSFVSNLYEVDSTPSQTRHLHYIYAENQLIAIFVKNSSLRNGTMYYMHPDILGSYDVVTTEGKAVAERYHFDPWGNRKNPDNWDIADTRTAFLFDRGFTGHEHLDVFKIINMNARLYDPVLGRFFSPDPYVQAPESAQGFNRYSYCANNPLTYTDPSGELINPIFDYFGIFLGTDDLGIQGEAIIMDRKDFTQGMSHEDAMQRGTLRNNLPMLIHSDILNKIDNQTSSFPSRPDWDGYLTLAEANDWYRNGNGQPLFTDLSKIDLSGIVSLGEKYVGQVKTFNLIFSSGSVNDGLVYGQITLKRYPNHTVRAFADQYNFEMHNWGNPLNWGRNIETSIGKKVAGQGTGYEINIYGSKKLTPILPWIK